MKDLNSKRYYIEWALIRHRQRYPWFNTMSTIEKFQPAVCNRLLISPQFKTICFFISINNYKAAKEIIHNTMNGWSLTLIEQVIKYIKKQQKRQNKIFIKE